MALDWYPWKTGRCSATPAMTHTMAHPPFSSSRSRPKPAGPSAPIVTCSLKRERRARASLRFFARKPEKRGHEVDKSNPDPGGARPTLDSPLRSPGVRRLARPWHDRVRTLRQYFQSHKHQHGPEHFSEQCDWRRTGNGSERHGVRPEIHYLRY